jgi:hypothetical protein
MLIDSGFEIYYQRFGWHHVMANKMEMEAVNRNLKLVDPPIVLWGSML